jgi:molybdate transport system substrate-binding protein
LFGLIALLLACTGCGQSKPDGTAASDTAAPNTAGSGTESAERVELTVSAAASLTDALKEIQKLYELKHPNVQLNFNFGSSGALQQQIEQGAPADLFLSAATKNMKALVDKQLIEPNKQRNVLTNELVVVVPADKDAAAVATMANLTRADVKHVAIGIPESVPAGAYTQEALQNAKLWDVLRPKTVQGKDVRQVLQYVETGNADAGFVYRTDALTSQRVKVAFAVDPGTYTPVQYPFGIVKASKHQKEAESLYSFLQSQVAMDVFKRFGFSAASK